jgi:hypothetical protein
MSYLLDPYRFGVATSVTYLGQAVGDGTGSTSESVTIDFGTGVAGSKIVVVLLQANWAGANNAPSTVTIDGQSASSAGTGAATGSERAHIYYFDDTAGDVSGSSTVNITWADAESIEVISAYRLTGVVTGAATNTATDNTTTATVTLSLNVNAGVLIAGSIERLTGDATNTWTGATEDMENTGSTGDYQCSTASQLLTATESPRTVTNVWGTAPSPARHCGMSAVWNAA